LHPLTAWLRKAGEVLCAEVSRFGRVSSNLRLPSQVSAIALDFVECWAAPKSMMKALADGLILCVVCSSYHHLGQYDIPAAINVQSRHKIFHQWHLF
jgi:hypothetical protein